jgi:exosortase/archaeosortase family protein
MQGSSVVRALCSLPLQIIGPGMIFVLFYAGQMFFPDFIYWLFAFPAARLTALFFGSSAFAGPDGDMIIPIADQCLRMVPGCSGFGFFCLLAGWVAVEYGRKLRGILLLKNLLAAFMLVYGVTIAANAIRMISAFYADQFCQMILPDNFRPAVHLWIGVGIFLSVLYGVVWCLQRESVCQK